MKIAIKPSLKILNNFNIYTPIIYFLLVISFLLKKLLSIFSFFIKWIYNINITLINKVIIEKILKNQLNPLFLNQEEKTKQIIYMITNNSKLIIFKNLLSNLII